VRAAEIDLPFWSEELRFWKCCRDSPCQDCSQILAHFPLDRAALWEVMDQGSGGSKAPK
jgi:hypothetical protein